MLVYEIFVGDRTAPYRVSSLVAAKKIVKKLRRETEDKMRLMKVRIEHGHVVHTEELGL